MVITLSVLVKYLTIIITNANINVAVIIISEPNSNSIKPGLKTIKIPTNPIRRPIVLWIFITSFKIIIDKTVAYNGTAKVKAAAFSYAIRLMPVKVNNIDIELIVPLNKWIFKFFVLKTLILLLIIIGKRIIRPRKALKKAII